MTLPLFPCVLKWNEQPPWVCHVPPHILALPMSSAASLEYHQQTVREVSFFKKLTFFAHFTAALLLAAATIHAVGLDWGIDGHLTFRSVENPGFYLWLRSCFLFYLNAFCKCIASISVKIFGTLIKQIGKLSVKGWNHDRNDLAASGGFFANLVPS